jgi:membrane-bound metal-dependent hydrolase YbcI (DUF457 family)
MPQAATHILVPLILMSLFRDYCIKNKKTFSIHYVLIAGIAGVLPDLDIAAFWILYFFGFTFNEVHRTFMHTLFIPILFLILSLIAFSFKFNNFGKNKLKLWIIFLMIAFGSFIHLLLDILLHGSMMPFYPISIFSIGLNLFGSLPHALEVIADPSLDAGLLIFSLIYLLWNKNKIKDFI